MSGGSRIRPSLAVAGAVVVLLSGYGVFRVTPALQEIRDEQESLGETEDELSSRLAAERTEIARLTPVVEALRKRPPAASDATSSVGDGTAEHVAAWAKAAGLTVGSFSFSAPGPSGAATAPDPEDASRPQPAAQGLRLVADGRFAAVRAFVRRLAEEPSRPDIARLELERRTDPPGVRLTVVITP